MKHIYSYLDLSTAHVTEKGSDWLERFAHDEAAPLGIASDSYGFWIAVPDVLEDTEGMPESVLDVLEKAQELNCTAVRLDRDGDILEGLGKYHW